MEESKKSAIPADNMLWAHIYKDPVGATIRGLDSQSKIKLEQ